MEESIFKFTGSTELYIEFTWGKYLEFTWKKVSSSLQGGKYPEFTVGKYLEFTWRKVS